MNNASTFSSHSVAVLYKPRKTAHNRFVGCVLDAKQDRFISHKVLLDFICKLQRIYAAQDKVKGKSNILQIMLKQNCQISLIEISL
jgi:hypothetical protein